MVHVSNSRQHVKGFSLSRNVLLALAIVLAVTSMGCGAYAWMYIKDIKEDLRSSEETLSWIREDVSRLETKNVEVEEAYLKLSNAVVYEHLREVSSLQDRMCGKHPPVPDGKKFIDFLKEYSQTSEGREMAECEKRARNKYVEDYINEHD